MSYFNAVEEIKKLDTTDPDYWDYVACIIKKSNHGAKAEIYSKLFLDIKWLAGRKPRAFKKGVKLLFNEYVKFKIQTHEEFYNERPIRKQIWNMFDWKKH